MELINFYVKRKKDIVNFLKTFSFFICIGAILIAIAPWQGEYHPNGSLSKSEFLVIVLYTYGVIISLVIAVMSIVFVIAKAFEAVLSKIKFLNWVQQKNEVTIQDVLISIGIFVSSATISYSLVSLFVYQH